MKIIKILLHASPKLKYIPQHLHISIIKYEKVPHLVFTSLFLFARWEIEIGAIGFFINLRIRVIEKHSKVLIKGTQFLGV